MASTYLSRTPSTSGNGQIWTYSAWIKRSNITDTYGTIFNAYNTSGSADTAVCVFYLYNNELYISGATGGAGSYPLLLRDVSAWYHIVVAFDTTQASLANRIKAYINGVQISLNNTTYPALNLVTPVNQNDEHTIGNRKWDGTIDRYFNGLISHVHLIDGIQYDASAFGETDATTGIWKPKTAPSVTYGTNGFFLKFENSGSMGTDSSGNGNNFSVNGNLTQTIDTPSNVFATLNPLDIDTALTYTFGKGNTDVTIADSGGEGMAKGTLGVSSGKYYWECKLVSSSVHGRFGVVSTATAPTGNPGEFGIAWQMNDATMQLVNSPVSGSWGSNPSNNDILMYALDCDNQAFYFGVNGTWRNSGDPTSGASKTGGVDYSGQSTLTSDYLTIGFGGNFFSGGGTQQGQYNFGNGYFGTTAVSSAENPDDGIGVFEYAVPTGYKALCTKSINAQEYS